MNAATATAIAPFAPKPAREVRVVEDVIPVLDTARFEHMNRIAHSMAKGSYIPDTLRGKGADGFAFEQTVANCFRIVNQAVRWNADPFSIIDGAFILRGKLGFEGKIIAAVVNTSGKIVGRLSYEYTGERGKPTRGVIVRGTFTDTGETAEIEGTVGEWATDNGNWKDQPDQQLAYRGAVVWARRHMPEILMGIYTDDDIDRMARNGTLRAGADGVYRPDPEGERPIAPPTSKPETQMLPFYSEEGELIESIGTPAAFAARIVSYASERELSGTAMEAYIGANDDGLAMLGDEQRNEVTQRLEQMGEEAPEPEPEPKRAAPKRTQAKQSESPAGASREQRADNSTTPSAPVQAAAAGEQSPAPAATVAAEQSQPAKPEKPRIPDASEIPEDVRGAYLRLLDRIQNQPDRKKLKAMWTFEQDTVRGLPPVARTGLEAAMQARREQLPEVAK